jgi:hypothetical protein
LTSLLDSAILAPGLEGGRMRCVIAGVSRKSTFEQRGRKKYQGFGAQGMAFEK